MSYFRGFPYVLDYRVQGRRHEAQDITRRVAFKQKDKENADVYLIYHIKDGESAHGIADRIYDDEQLYWIILMFNDIINPISQWPMSTRTLEDYINRKYKNPDSLHHYESIKTGARVDHTHPQHDRRGVTNREYEYEKNESKRKIKIPLPNYVSDLVNQKRQLIKQ